MCIILFLYRGEFGLDGRYGVKGIFGDRGLKGQRGPAADWTEPGEDGLSSFLELFSINKFICLNRKSWR